VITTRRSTAVEARLGETQQETLDRLRQEVEMLRASRERLVLAADADRRDIERALHDGVHQRLIALAVNLQLASELADARPGEVKVLLEDMSRDVELALDELAQLGHRIHPPLLDAPGLGAALRAAAAIADAHVSVDVRATASTPPEVVSTVYLCCRAALGHTRATVTVREVEGALAFEVGIGDAWSDASLSRLLDRVEALGGELAIASEAGGGTRMTGSVPLSR
jgi:signal transduction histidine kinase